MIRKISRCDASALAAVLVLKRKYTHTETNASHVAYILCCLIALWVSMCVCVECSDSATQQLPSDADSDVQ